MADHRLPMRSRDITAMAQMIAGQLSVPTAKSPAAQIPTEWVAAVVRDLKLHRGRSLVVAGDQQPPAVHALVHAINEALGNCGKTVIYTEPLEVNPSNQMASLRVLIE